MTVLHPQLGDPDFDGYLMKQGEVQKQWQKRWFVLKEIFLWYMDSHLGSPILGIIPLEGADVTTGGPDGTNRITIVSPVLSRTYHFEAATEDACQGWSALLKNSARQQVQLSPANEAAMQWLVANSAQAKLESVYRYAIPQLLYPDLKGYLVKQGSTFPWNWKQRLFVLFGSGLWFFGDRNSTAPQGVVNLYGCCCELADYKAECCFEVEQLDGEKLYMIAQCTEDRDRWMASISSAIQRPPGDDMSDQALKQWGAGEPPVEQVSGDMSAGAVSWSEADDGQDGVEHMLPTADPLPVLNPTNAEFNSTHISQLDSPDPVSSFGVEPISTAETNVETSFEKGTREESGSVQTPESGDENVSAVKDSPSGSPSVSQSDDEDNPVPDTAAHEM